MFAWFSVAGIAVPRSWEPCAPRVSATPLCYLAGGLICGGGVPLHPASLRLRRRLRSAEPDALRGESIGAGSRSVGPERPTVVARRDDGKSASRRRSPGTRMPWGEAEGGLPADGPTPCGVPRFRAGMDGSVCRKLGKIHGVFRAGRCRFALLFCVFLAGEKEVPGKSRNGRSDCLEAGLGSFGCRVLDNPRSRKDGALSHPLFACRFPR